MNAGDDYPLQGGCSCGGVRYRMMTAPLFVHCCHCRWCQRESGASYALNAMIEADRVELLTGEPEIVDTPSESGKGQKVHRCPACKVALWSNFAGAGDAIHFVRVGTLDNPDAIRPDVNIFVASKQPWVKLSPDIPSFEAFYNPAKLWPAESQARRKAVLAGAEGLK